MHALNSKEVQSARSVRTSKALLAAAAMIAMVSGIFLGVTPAHAAEVLVDGMRFSVDDANPGAGATLTAYEGAATSVSIPASVSIGGTDHAVTRIGVDAFLAKGLTSVSIPANVTVIDDGAFAENALTSVGLPMGLTSIGTIAFADNALAELTIPETVTSLGNGVFAINQLTTVTVPPSITRIPANAFAVNLLTSVSLPDTITEIGGRAFRENRLTTLDIPPLVTHIDNESYAGNRFTSITIPDHVTSIGQLAFVDNELLTHVSLGNGVTVIRGGAFGEVLTEADPIPCNIASVDFGTSIRELLDGVFQGCKLTSVDFPDSLREIGLAAFSGNQLASIDFGTGIESVLFSAFSYNQLTEVTIPASMTFIGPAIFRGNPLTSAKFIGAAPGHLGAPLLHSFLEDVSGLLVDYYWRYGADAGVDGGFTSPTWEGYTTRAIAIVDFNLHGHGDPVAFAETPIGGTVSAPTTPSAAGWSFQGWFTDATFSTPFDFGAVINSDAVAHAKWTAVTGVSVDLAADEVAAEGRAFTVRAEVAATDATAPTPQGTVLFLLDGDPVGEPVTLDADGAAEIEVPGADAGQYTLEAVFLASSDAWDDSRGESDLTVLTIGQATAVIQLDASALEVNEGESITLTTTAFDSNGDELGDVTDDAEYSSSVDTDIFDGATVQFPTASVHTITANFAGAEAQVDVTVVPPPVPAPADTGDLAVTGADILPGLLTTTMLLLLGASLVVIRRSREKA